MTPLCSLCERPTLDLTAHHLVPKQVGRRRGRRLVDLPVAMLCRACHRQLHALFDNKTLASRLDSVASMKEDPDVARFLTWLRKQPPEKGIRVKG